MKLGKIAALAAATSMIAAAPVAQAVNASNLSLSRASTTAGKSNKQFAEFSPLYVIGGIVATVAILEVTGAIDIFGDDEPESP